MRGTNMTANKASLARGVMVLVLALMLVLSPFGQASRAYAQPSDGESDSVVLRDEQVGGELHESDGTNDRSSTADSELEGTDGGHSSSAGSGDGATDEKNPAADDQSAPSRDDSAPSDEASAQEDGTGQDRDAASTLAQDAVATIGSQRYSSLEAAVSAAASVIASEGSCTIELHRDSTVSTTLRVAGGMLVIKAADGSSPQVTFGARGKDGAVPLFSVSGASSGLTLEGIEFAGSMPNTGDAPRQHAIEAKTGATVVLDGATLRNFACPYAGTSEANAKGSGSTVYAEGSARIVMKGASRITAGNPQASRANQNLGTVFLDASELSMEGTSAIDSSYATAGGAVFAARGSTVRMAQSSRIADCVATGAQSSEGGGVYLSGSTFSMADNARITGCKAVAGTGGNKWKTNHGGGVCVVSGSSFTMDGSAKIDGCTSLNGGAVVVGHWAKLQADGSTFVMGGSSSVEGNTTGYSGAIALMNQVEATIGGSARVQGNTATGDLASAVLVDCYGVNLKFKPVLTVTDNACISGNRNEFSRTATQDITSASAIAMRRCEGTVNLNGYAHVVGNYTNSSRSVTSAVGIYNDSTLNLSGNAVVADNQAPNSAYGCGIYLWPNSDSGKAAIWGAPSVTGNTGAQGIERDLLVTRNGSVSVAGDIVGGKVGVSAPQPRKDSSWFASEDYASEGKTFAFVAQGQASSYAGLDRFFNNDNEGLYGTAGAGGAVVWGRGQGPDVPGGQDPDKPAAGRLVVEKHVAVDGGQNYLDLSKAFSMEATLDAPYQNVSATVYDASGAPALDADGNPVKAEVACWTGEDSGVCPPGDYSCGSKTIVFFALKDGQYVVISGIAEGTVYTVRETDPSVRDTPHAAADASFIATVKVDGSSYTSGDASDVTHVEGTIGEDGTAVAYTNTAEFVPNTAVQAGETPPAWRLVALATVGACLLGAWRLHARRARRHCEF